MAVSAEASYVYAFAVSLAIGSAVLLFVPLFRYLRDVAAGRSPLLLAVGGMLGLSVAAIFGITSAPSDPALLLPLAAVTVVLRLASPTLLYRGIRDRLEARRTWPAIRLFLGIAFVGFAALLVYGLIAVLLGQVPPWPATLSEQFAMALGASFLVLRTAYRFRPRFTAELWSFWMSATAFAVAFIVISPYAFPAYAMAYWVSGLLGWMAGLVALRFAD